MYFQSPCKLLPTKIINPLQTFVDATYRGASTMCRGSEK